MRELLPAASNLALLVNPTNPNVEIVSNDLQTAAHPLDLQLRVLHASTEREIDGAFAALVQQRVGALVVGPDAFFDNQRRSDRGAGSPHAIPAIYERRDAVVDGGLMSYGTSILGCIPSGRHLYRPYPQGREADRSRRLLQSVKFELVLNLKTAKALGLTLPSGLLSIVDEVIE